MLQKIITLANFKGGIGKSTSTASIGACLAMKGYKVLLVDLDGQSNLTLYYVQNADNLETSIFDTLIHDASLPIINVKPNLDIVPSSLEMASAEIAMTNMLARELLLTRALTSVKSHYDFILIDCPPSLGIVTTNAFLAADEILVPMTPELLPLKGMKMLDSFVSSLQVIKPSVKLNGVFITRYNHRKLNKVVAEALKNRYADITFHTIIRENISLAESAGSGKSIFEYEPNSNGAKDYLELTNELINHLNIV
ncbi:MULTISPECIES: ParA family protein [Segatella]|uniref:Sporulation initiation inhibitor protein Soj n=2 Tax=Segatella TaxID=2974251 RepID=D8DX29_9BACT|nr:MULTISPECIES: ParA family protein [Segatella]EFI71949.1 sporulation initiation inhibitor protein Soj [Segatella baroniae B14]UKK78842.1 ParA family protein [Segatella baroniae B14]SEQ89302.1 chromosome partitioning protein [Segatella baroniae B14]